jgi:hypothetical protein
MNTRMHGLADYLTAMVLLCLPSLAAWEGPLMRLSLSAGLTLAILSLFTRYEFGIFRLIPMPTHLILDGVLGVVLVLTGLLLPGLSLTQMGFLILVGILEMGGALVTERQPRTIEPGLEP